MNPNLDKLIPAIVSLVNERESYVSKTKLLKLLYLFDVEWYRIHRETYTGFDWVFLHLGPWTSEYDPLLERLAANLVINIRKSGNPSFDTEFIKTRESVDLGKLFTSYKEEFILKNVLSTWGEKSTAQILDYVYFWTEPMKDAERYQPIDFSTVSEESPPQYRRTSSGATKAEIEAARARITEAAKNLPKAERGALPAARYDQEYFDAMEKLEAN